MDDWISRKRLNEAIEYEYDDVCVYDVSGTQAISDFQDIVDRQPAADVAPVVHGHWKNNSNGTVSCSCCATWFQKEREPYLLYCGHCGAKMDEEGE